MLNELRRKRNTALLNIRQKFSHMYITAVINEITSIQRVYYVFSIY